LGDLDTWFLGPTPDSTTQAASPAVQQLFRDHDATDDYAMSATIGRIYVYTTVMALDSTYQNTLLI